MLKISRRRVETTKSGGFQVFFRVFCVCVFFLRTYRGSNSFFVSLVRSDDFFFLCAGGRGVNPAYLSVHTN